MNGLVALAAVLLMLLVAGAAIGIVGRRPVAWGWLLAAVALVAIEDALLTRGYGLMPRLVGRWNWEGKAMALAATLAIAALPAIGRRRAGLTIAQAPGSMRPCAIVAGLYCAFFVALALALPNGGYTSEDLAFQLTMPGLEEEPLYRGLLLLVLDRAFAGRRRFAGVDWGWGAILSSALFGLEHAFGFAHGAFAFDPLTMALTAVPSLLGVWLRMRSGSVAWPILVHNFGNTAMLLL